MPDFGYAGEILKVDLSDGRVEKLPTDIYAEKHIAGRGLAARLYWELVPTQANAFDADNCLICATGPLTGFTGFAGCRWTICRKTPLDNPESFSYGNLGGRWGRGELFYDVYGLVPGPGEEVVSRPGAVVDREKFEAMKTEYYDLRGWDAVIGLPTRKTLTALELDDVAADLTTRSLLT